jgi:hypothetical protein
VDHTGVIYRGTQTGHTVLSVRKEIYRNAGKRATYVAGMPKNGQVLAWETAKNIWGKTTDRNWPDVSLGLIRGATSFTFEGDLNNDPERLRILMSMIIWAIWKLRNKNSINDQDVAAGNARKELKGLIKDLIMKSWNATRFMEGGRRMNR